MSCSFSSPNYRDQQVSRPSGNKRRVGGNIRGERSVHEALKKFERRMKRSMRKLKKKKLLNEFGVKTGMIKHRHMEVFSSSLSFGDIRNRNSVLFKEASKTLALKDSLGISLKGGRNFNLKKFVEMQEEEIADRGKAERESCDLDDVEDEDLEDGASLSLEF